MKYLLLWFEASLQSWGSDSKFDMRMTRDFPTKSGIFGLLLSAAGETGPQREKLARLAASPLVAYTFCELEKKKNIPLLNDFHMVGSGYDTKNLWEKLFIPLSANKKNATQKLTYRHYLQDRKLAAIIGLEDDLAQFYFDALKNPVYPIYLGRKCCVPTDIVLRGDSPFNSFDEAKEALDTLLDTKNKETLDANAKKLVYDYIVEEVPIATEESMEIYDVPVQFGLHKVYKDRWVLKTSLREIE